MPPSFAWLTLPMCAMLPAWVLGVALLVALAIDRWLGEPPERLHPVVWMGRALGWSGRWLQTHTRQRPGNAPDYKAFLLGALVWIAWAALILIVATGLQYRVVYGVACCVVPGLAAVTGMDAGQGAWAAAGVGVGFFAPLLLGLMLKPLLAWALLKSEVLAVERALSPAHGGSLEAGRERLRWLVSRDVTQLTETEVRESAIETLAENLNDSVIAPIFWFALLGLPGAALFRFANTADAMWGYPGVYQGQNWAWAGKWAARADDALCYVPARITGLILLLVAGVPVLQGYRATERGAASRWARVCQLRHEAAKTPSPNSGWPMAAMALNLGVALCKPGGYVLNPQGRAATAPDTAQAVASASKVLVALVMFALVAIVLIVKVDML